jgi:hypothetical protein
MNFLLRYMWLLWLVVVIKLFPVEPQRTSDPSKSSTEDFGIRYCFEREPSITIKSWSSAAMLPTGAPSFILTPLCVLLLCPSLGLAIRMKVEVSIHFTACYNSTED